MHDFHTHFIPNEVTDWLKDHQQTVHAEWVNKDPSKEPFLIINKKWGFELKKTFINQQLYLEEQQMAGVHHSMVSPIPQLFMYDFQDEITNEISEVYNQALANWTKLHSTSLSALGTVPLNNPTKAATMLNQAIHQGLKGVIIGPGYANYMLSDEFFTPFFEEANRLKAIVFIHPLLSEDPRLKNRKMPNLIGVPWETTVCATDILLSGLIDKYPNLKLLFAHGGGLLPYQIGRLDKGYTQWKEVSANLVAKPSEYVKKFWYDTVLWNKDSIDYLTKTVGKDKIVPGSDFPFDLSAWPPTSEYEEGVKSLLSNK